MATRTALVLAALLRNSTGAGAPTLAALPPLGLTTAQVNDTLLQLGQDGLARTDGWTLNWATRRDVRAWRLTDRGVVAAQAEAEAIRLLADWDAEQDLLLGC